MTKRSTQNMICNIHDILSNTKNIHGSQYYCVITISYDNIEHIYYVSYEIHSSSSSIKQNIYDKFIKESPNNFMIVNDYLKSMYGIKPLFYTNQLIYKCFINNSDELKFSVDIGNIFVNTYVDFEKYIKSIKLDVTRYIICDNCHECKCDHECDHKCKHKSPVINKTQKNIPHIFMNTSIDTNTDKILDHSPNIEVYHKLIHDIDEEIMQITKTIFKLNNMIQQLEHDNKILKNKKLELGKIIIQKKAELFEKKPDIISQEDKGLFKPMDEELKSKYRNYINNIMIKEQEQKREQEQKHNQICDLDQELIKEQKHKRKLNIKRKKSKASHTYIPEMKFMQDMEALRCKNYKMYMNEYRNYITNDETYECCMDQSQSLNDFVANYINQLDDGIVIDKKE